MRLKQNDITLLDIIQVVASLRDTEWEAIEAMGGPRDMDWMIAHCYGLPGPKWAYKADDMAYLCCGFIPIRAGVFKTWFLASRQGWDHFGKDLTAIATDLLGKQLDTGAHRLETVSLATHERAHRWYKTIGLRLESTLQGYCIDGSDALMHVATRRKH